MLPFKLTASQKRQLEEAKAPQKGKNRVVLKLTESQRKLDRIFVADIEDLARIELSRDFEPSNLAEQLRRAREEAGLSLAAVSKRASMTRQAVLAIESGKNANPKIDTLKRLADALGLKLQLSLSAKR
jgi:ribosome-binding protein aMBF1 (putative translation factor)